MDFQPKVINFRDADDFLYYIKDDIWDVSNSDCELSCLVEKNWVFRGVGNCDFELIPSAWRCKRFQNQSWAHIDLINPDRPWVKIVADRYRELNLNIEHINQLFQQIFLEMYIVQDFITLSNRVRLPVESVLPFNINLSFNTFDKKNLFWHRVCNEFIDWIQKFDEFDISTDTSDERDIIFDTNKFFFPYLCPQYDEHAVAYAQHHGIPTRLLDFTYNPLKATWFALKQHTDIMNQSKANMPEYFSVIAIHKGMMGSACEIASSYTMGALDFVDGFKMSNFHNLFNQEGVFLSMAYANKYCYKNGKWPNLNQYLSQYKNVLDMENIGNYYLQLNIPIAAVEDLKTKLEKIDISRPYLMPSYDHVAAQILSLGMYKNS